jgi:hypothetical protein
VYAAEWGSAMPWGPSRRAPEAARERPQALPDTRAGGQPSRFEDNERKVMQDGPKDVVDLHDQSAPY